MRRARPLAVTNVLLGLAVLALVLNPLFAGASHQPADKVAAAGSNLEQFDDATPLLTETMKVSTPSDLILSVTAECSIITELVTGGANPSMSEASGTVDVWITIDGTVVPITTSDPDDGAVTFCNRTYGRTVEDAENDDDGTDEESDYIRTRNANGFNWLALDVGRDYDDPSNGNNIVEIVVWADYSTSEFGEAVADAYVGKRTLIVEPTKVSVHETV